MILIRILWGGGGCRQCTHVDQWDPEGEELKEPQIASAHRAVPNSQIHNGRVVGNSWLISLASATNAKLGEIWKRRGRKEPPKVSGISGAQESMTASSSGRAHIQNRIGFGSFLSLFLFCSGLTNNGEYSDAHGSFPLWWILRLRKCSHGYLKVLWSLFKKMSSFPECIPELLNWCLLGMVFPVLLRKCRIAWQKNRGHPSPLAFVLPSSVILFRWPCSLGVGSPPSWEWFTSRILCPLRQLSQYHLLPLLPHDEVVLGSTEQVPEKNLNAKTWYLWREMFVAFKHS